LGAYAPINFTRDTQKKYFDPIGRRRVKKLGQKGRVQERGERGRGGKKEKRMTEYEVQSRLIDDG
jgi:hypothetical protein